MSDTTETGKPRIDHPPWRCIRSCRGLCENNQSHVLECVEPCWSRVRGKVEYWVQKRLSRGAQVLGQTFYLCYTTAFIVTLVISCQNIHTHNDNEKLNGWFEVLHAPFLPLIHQAHRTETENAHPFSSGTHMSDTARTMIIKQKNSKVLKMKKRREDLEVWYTHCLAHHLPGAPNTYYLAHPVVSQEAITCNNTPVALEMGNCKLSIIFDTWLYSLFSLPPPRGWLLQTNVFWCFVSKIYWPFVQWIFINSKKNAKIPNNLWTGIY